MISRVMKDLVASGILTVGSTGIVVRKAPSVRG